MCSTECFMVGCERLSDGDMSSFSCMPSAFHNESSFTSTYCTVLAVKSDLADILRNSFPTVATAFPFIVICVA